MKKIFKSFICMSLVLMCASSLFAQQPASDSQSTSLDAGSAAAPQQSPSDSVVSTPSTTSASVPDAQAVPQTQTSQPASPTIPVPAVQPVPAAQSTPSAQPDDQSLQPIQKDDKKSLTVMTSDIPGKDIDKKDWLSEAFTPVGDFTYDAIKTSSDALGGFCQGCVDAFDGITKAMLTPFGFKEEPKEKRTYSPTE